MATSPPLPPASAAAPLDLVWDMETGDPDDFLTLLLLLGHPAVRLRAVTVTPGTPDQIGVVRAALAWFGRERDVPVGAFDLDHRPGGAREAKALGGAPSRKVSGRHGRRGLCVSSWHYAAFGDLPPSREASPGPELLRDICDENTTLVTGGPLRNLGRALQLPGFRLGRLVAQGGFAGEGVVPVDQQLPKFRGRTVVGTYNLNGDVPAALAVLSTDLIGARRFVSKNVCHGVVYDRALHARVDAARAASPSLQRIWQGMEAHLGPERTPSPRNEAITADRVRLVHGDPGTRPRPVEMGRVEALGLARGAGLDLVAVTRDPSPVCRLLGPPEPEVPGGKALHDPLAACCAIDEGIGTWAEVALYRERGEWGSRLAPGSGVFIIVGYDPARFVRTLLASADRRG
jgi:inosine-uridine nucleoside N-ribohydrolase